MSKIRKYVCKECKEIYFAPEDTIIKYCPFCGKPIHNETEIRRIIEVEVLASNKEAINELEKNIYDMNGRRFDKGKIRIVNTRWKRN